MGLITSGKFAELEGLLSHLNTEVNGNLIPKITTIIEDLGAELTPRDSALMWKLKLKAESIELFTGELMNEVEVLNTRLDNPESATGDSATDCDEQKTIKACLDAALEALFADEPDFAEVRGFLELAYQNIRRAIREANRLVRKKKLIIMRISTLISLCSRVEACANFTLSGGESAGTQVKPAELKAEQSATVSVYNLKGQLVVAQAAASTLESVKAQLANGVYVAVIQHFDAGGKLISREVQRLVLVR
jgi:DNA gyrase/topoisomerase IV subunit B